MTALILACDKGHTATAVALAELGANKDLTDEVNDQSPPLEDSHTYTHIYHNETEE